MKSQTKKISIFAILSLVLCVISVANVRSLFKESDAVAGNAEVRSELRFNPNPIVVKVGMTTDVVASFPLGYNNLNFEDNEYCEIQVSGTNIKVLGVKSTKGSDVAVRGSVYPIFITARDIEPISSFLIVEVQN